MLRLVRTVLLVAATAYPIFLLVIILLFRFVGEYWWVTTVGLYVPRVVFAVPLPFTIAAAWWCSRRLLLLPQLLAVCLLSFPLMGLRLGVARSSPVTNGEFIRLVTYNIGTGNHLDRVLEQAKSFEPNVVVLQESHENLRKRLAASFLGWHVDQRGQFFLASRYPIREVYDPPRISYPNGQGGSHFVSYLLETPLGLISVFNVHTTSPRDGFEDLRGNGFREEIRTGRLFSGARSELVEFNAHRRQRQIAAAVSKAREGPYPFIIAGDTNLPSLSRVLSEQLGGLQDAFDVAGRGFGYTFPSKYPWMRIDRILLAGPLQAFEMKTGNSLASDHLCVFSSIGPGQ